MISFKIMQYYFVTLCMTWCLFVNHAANAEKVRWVTPSWQDYTNSHGTGLYVEIVRAAFADHQLDIVKMPWKRSLLEVKNGTADMTGATSFVDGYITAKLAMLAPPISILFKKKRFTYSDLPSLANYVAVWASPYQDELIGGQHKAYINGFSVLERETGYKLLVSGRADYFVDTKALHQTWLDGLKLQPKGTQAFEYQIVDISNLNLYMIFSQSPRGQRLKGIYDLGIEKLIQNGQLREIYQKYHFLKQMPNALR